MANKSEPQIIFVSYRRNDTKSEAARLKHDLEASLQARVFVDFKGISGGEDFAQKIDIELSRARAVLALIDPAWLAPSDDSDTELRLQETGDWVRRELELALERDIPLIPLYVNGTEPLSSDFAAKVPTLARLATLHGARLRAEDWGTDVQALVSVLTDSHGVRPRKTMGLWVWLALAALLLAPLLLVWQFKQSLPPTVRAVKDALDRPSTVLPALGAAASLGKPATALAPALVELMEHEEYLVRFEAAFALAQVDPQNEATIGALELAMSHDDFGITLLRQWGDNDRAPVIALTELVDLLDRRAARRLLPHLRETAEHEEPWVRIQAASAILELEPGEAAAQDDLIDAALEVFDHRDERPYLEQVAIRALASLPMNRTRSLAWQIVERIDRRWSLSGGYAAATMVELAALDPEFETVCARIVEHIRAETSELRFLDNFLVATSRFAVGPLADILDDHDTIYASTRNHADHPISVALETLREIGPAAKAAVPAIVRLLRSEREREAEAPGSAQWAKQALRTLAHIGPARDSRNLRAAVGWWLSLETNVDCDSLEDALTAVVACKVASRPIVSLVEKKPCQDDNDVALLTALARWQCDPDDNGAEAVDQIDARVRTEELILGPASFLKPVIVDLLSQRSERTDALIRRMLGASGEYDILDWHGPGVSARRLALEALNEDGERVRAFQHEIEALVRQSGNGWDFTFGESAGSNFGPTILGPGSDTKLALDLLAGYTSYVEQVIEQLRASGAIDSDAVYPLYLLERRAAPATDMLVAWLEDESLDDDLRARIYLILGRIGPDAAGAAFAMLKAIEGFPSYRMGGTWMHLSLAELGERALPSLIDAIPNENKYVQTVVVRALSDIGTQARSAQNALVSAYWKEDGDLRRYELMETLGRISR